MLRGFLVLAVLVFGLAMPSASATDNAGALIFVDVWHVGGSTYLNLTVRFYDTTLAGTPRAEVWGHNADATSVFALWTKNLASISSEVWSANGTIDPSYDSYAMRLGFDTSGLDSHSHTQFASWRGYDLMRTNPDDDYFRDELHHPSWLNGTYQPYANATFEGQAYANTTRAEMNATSEATYEGQVHANATWCALPCAPGESDFVGNDWFNSTWRWEPQFGNVTALSLMVGGWTNTTNLSAGDLTLQSAVQLETEWDPYIPALFWGTLLVFFLYFRAWFPAAAVLLAFANAILPTPLWGLQASLMLAMIALVVHVALKEGFRPRDAGEKGDI